MLRPKLKSKYHVEYVDGEGIFLLAERETFVLEGAPLFSIVPLLDGTRSVDAIVSEATPWVAPNDAYAALELLNREGHLADADPRAPAAAAAFWSEFDVDTRRLPELLGSFPVEVCAVGDVDTGPMLQMLGAAGVRCGRGGAARVAVAEDYLHPDLDLLNRESFVSGTPLLLVKPVGVRIWVGPLIVPGRSACWNCLERRLRGNREVERFVAEKSGRHEPFPLAKSRQKLGELQAATMAAMQFLRWMATGTAPDIESRLLVADLVAFTFGFHDVIRLPDCEVCGDAGLPRRTGQPIDLGGDGIERQALAGLRSENPEVTFDRLRHHISPFTGIVDHVEPGQWHGAGPIRTYIAGHNFALKTNQLWFLKDGLRTRSSGKGWTSEQARTSALCEALERHAGVYRDGDVVRTGSRAEIGEDAIDPRTAMLFSERQYRDREAWRARNSRFQIVPEPFDDEATLHWSPAWSLTSERVRYLPTSYLFYNFPQDAEPFVAWADSNGAAAGSTMQEAILQGLLELVERDAVALWWYNMAPRPGVDLDAIDDENIRQMRSFYARCGRELWVLDLTADLEIPVFVAISRRTNAPTEDIMMGFGAHLDARIALSRALTELNQFIPALLNVAPDGRTAYVMGDQDTVHWWTTATVDNQPYLVPDPTRPAAVPTARQNDTGALREVIRRVEAAGHEILVADQTRPDVDLCVVKVLAPGLRHFWARFAPGRLYDVPVALGWRDAPLEERDLNPIPMFL